MVNITDNDRWGSYYRFYGLDMYLQVMVITLYPLAKVDYEPSRTTEEDDPAS